MRELYDPETGYRDGVAEGLRGEDRNAVASCFCNLVKDPKALSTSRRLKPFVLQSNVCSCGR